MSMTHEQYLEVVAWACDLEKADLPRRMRDQLALQVARLGPRRLDDETLRVIVAALKAYQELPDPWLTQQTMSPAEFRFVHAAVVGVDRDLGELLGVLHSRADWVGAPGYAMGIYLMFLPSNFAQGLSAGHSYRVAVEASA